jgi:hypothetical protein
MPYVRHIKIAGCGLLTFVSDFLAVTNKIQYPISAAYIIKRKVPIMAVFGVMDVGTYSRDNPRRFGFTMVEHITIEAILTSRARGVKTCNLEANVNDLRYMLNE